MGIISFDFVVFVDAGIGEGAVHLLENDEIAELAPMMGLRLKIKAFRDKIKVKVIISSFSIYFGVIVRYMD